MARNIVKDYLDYDREILKEYVNTITEKKLGNKISDMIVDTYINVEYFDMYEHVKKYPIDNFEYYVKENFKKDFLDKNKDKNILLINDALIILRYVALLEKYGKNDKMVKLLTDYEEKLKNKYKDTKILITPLIKLIKDNLHNKDKFLNGALSNDFVVIKKNTNIENVYDTYFESDVKIPDLFSDVAINRVYNSGAIHEDKMLVFYHLVDREILLDMINSEYKSIYLVDFPGSLIDKKTKLVTLLKIIDLDYLRERVILKIGYHDYMEMKDEYDSLIHQGYSFAVIIDDDIKNNIGLLNVFSYILVSDEDKDEFMKKFDNVILI